MKRNPLFTRTVSLFLAATLLLSSCSSYTLIQSEPAGARLYINGERVGNTPYTHYDTKIVGSVNNVRLEKEGYQPLQTAFSRDEEVDFGAIIGGLFFLFPFLWTMKYKPAHTYELVPDMDYYDWQEYQQNEPLQPAGQTKVEKLRELKQLLDDGILTNEEFQKEKEKILKEE